MTISEMANEARDLSKRDKISIPLAVYKICERYKCLNLRSQICSELGRRRRRKSVRKSLPKKKGLLWGEEFFADAVRNEVSLINSLPERDRD